MGNRNSKPKQTGSVKYDLKGKLNDFVIIVKSNNSKREFYCHKSKIIELDYFKTMFKQENCIEVKNSQANFDDRNPEAFQLILDYIYYGRINEIKCIIDYLDSVILTDYLLCPKLKKILLENELSFLKFITNENCLLVLIKAKAHFNSLQIIYKKAFNHCLKYYYDLKFPQPDRDKALLTIDNNELKSDLEKSGRVRLKNCIIVFDDFSNLFTYYPEIKQRKVRKVNHSIKGTTCKGALLADSIYMYQRNYETNEDLYIKYNLLTKVWNKNPIELEIFREKQVVIQLLAGINGNLYAVLESSTFKTGSMIQKYCSSKKEWSTCAMMKHAPVWPLMTTGSDRNFIVSICYSNRTDDLVTLIQYYNALTDNWSEVFETKERFHYCDSCCVIKQKAYYFGLVVRIHNIETDVWSEFSKGDVELVITGYTVFKGYYYLLGHYMSLPANRVYLLSLKDSCFATDKSGKTELLAYHFLTKRQNLTISLAP